MSTSTSWQGRLLPLVAPLLALLLALLLGGSCSSVEKTPGGGTGGDPDISRCSTAVPVCISSCSVTEWTSTLQPTCDANGTWRCPAGTVDYNDCPPGACARAQSSCCDVVTGGIAPPPCQADGLSGACPPGTRDGVSMCIPDGLGISDCGTLAGKACTQLDQRCSNGATKCACTAGDGGIAWECQISIVN